MHHPDDVIHCRIRCGCCRADCGDGLRPKSSQGSTRGGGMAIAVGVLILPCALSLNTQYSIPLSIPIPVESWVSCYHTINPLAFRVDFRLPHCLGAEETQLLSTAPIEPYLKEQNGSSQVYFALKPRQPYAPLDIL